MNLIEKMSCNMTDYIQIKTHSIDEEKKEVLKYGFYLLFADLTKLTITLSLAYLLGIFKLTLFTFVSFGILRSLAGGVHSKTWTGCLIVNTLVSFSIVYSSLLLSHISLNIFSVCVFIINFIVFYKYAPADQENKPLVGKKHKKKLRLSCFIVLTMQTLIAVLVNVQPFSNILIVSTIAISLSILPITYKISGNKKGNYSD